MHDPYMDLFERRLERIARARRRAQAFGAEVLVPRAAPRRHAMPRGTMLLAVTLSLTLAKGGALAALGPEVYADRLAQLRAGTGLQQAAALVMVPDPASREVARAIRPLLR